METPNGSSCETVNVRCFSGGGTNDEALAMLAALNPADFNELSESEKRHFYKCQQCGKMVAMRRLGDVLFHEDQVPDQRFSRAVQRNYEAAFM
jgi:hypothetical protein